MGFKWTDREREYLLTWLGRKPLPQLASEISAIEGVTRTPWAVQQKAGKIGLNQRSAQGDHTLSEIATAIGVRHPTVQSWRAIGLEAVKGYSTGRARARMVTVDEVHRFARERPELFNPDLCIPRRCKDIGLDIVAFRTPYRWKRVECRQSDLHATGQRLTFWAPIYEPLPVCPCCGRKVSGISVGGRRTRYAVSEPPQPTGIETVNTALLTYLRLLYEGGEMSMMDIGTRHTGKSSAIAASCVSGRIRSLMRLGMVHRRKVRMSAVNRLDWAYSLTPDGVAVVVAVTTAVAA